MKTVHIELQRVQSWLFSAPKLRAMIGANTLLGEVLRNGLPELARQTAMWSTAEVKGYPPVDPDDPVREADNPASDASGGILSRDGGHFEAVFSRGAEEFADAAKAELDRKLPGVRYRISIGDYPPPDPAGARHQDRHEVIGSAVALSPELPVLARCAWTGRGLASKQVWQGDEPAEVTQEVAERHHAGQRAQEGNARDLVTLLINRTKLKGLRRPQTFEELTSGGYLAVIHADGNGIGDASRQNPKSSAEFFHRNRVLLRRALRYAVDQACERAAADKSPAEKVIATPLLPLMLGGDDLLVVSRAKMALPFVVDLCEELERLQRPKPGNFHLTLGVGIVFAKPTIPFHRLHDVAASLAASAKRLFRGLDKDKGVSVADWAVYTTSWVDDPGEIRRRDWVRGQGNDARVLSLRPVPVSGQSLSSIKGLLGAARSLSAAPRSQLRFLADQLTRGKALSDLAFEELSPKAKLALKNAGVSQLWRRDHPTQPYWTSLLDLVEVFEIENLGRKVPKKSAVEAKTGDEAGDKVEKINA